jgi:hypothetical protein
VQSDWFTPLLTVVMVCVTHQPVGYHQKGIQGPWQLAHEANLSPLDIAMENKYVFFTGDTISRVIGIHLVNRVPL